MNIKYTVIIIIILALAGFGVFYYTSHPALFGNTPNSTQPVKDTTPPSTFANTAFSGFPKELVPADAGAPQYFDNADYTGAIFLVKKPASSIETAYEKQLASTDWLVIHKVINTNRTIFSLTNEKASKVATVQINLMSAAASNVIISIKK